jgi:hypothetical protein
MPCTLNSRDVFQAYASTLQCALKDAFASPLAWSVVAEVVGAGDLNASWDDADSVIARLERIIEDLGNMLAILRRTVCEEASVRPADTDRPRLREH